MWAAGLNPFLELTPAQAEWVSPIFTQYNLYIKAKNLGMELRPTDIDIGTLEDLSIVSTAISDIEERKRKRKRR